VGHRERETALPIGATVAEVFRDQRAGVVRPDDDPRDQMEVGEGRLRNPQAE
jgi:hypothetical protein